MLKTTVHKTIGGVKIWFDFCFDPISDDPSEGVILTRAFSETNFRIAPSYFDGLPELEEAFIAANDELVK